MSTSLQQTTLSAALTSTATTFSVASATYLSAPTNNLYQKIYVIDPGSTKGELMTVTALSGTTVTVSRLDEFKGPHLSGAIVIINPIDTSISDGFLGKDPDPVPALAPVMTWVVNVTNGNQWLYSSVTKSWVPGFNNASAPVSVTAAVAATAAVLPAPSGPLFHVTASGTPAVTGITMPNGFTSGSITLIPDNAFTWTTGDGSIGVGGTAVVAKALTFIYDANAKVWYPSYVA